MSATIDYAIQHFEVFCPQEQCGDPVVGQNGAVYHTKRRMSYAGLSFTGDWIYRCPCCSRTRRFRRSFFGDNITEV